jgi:hypothetical protein
MGKTTPPMSGLMHKEMSELRRFRRALRKEDQLVFDSLWIHVTKHMMPCTQASHLLPLEIFLFTMLLEEHKELRRIKRMLDELQLKQCRPGQLPGRLPLPCQDNGGRWSIAIVAREKTTNTGL